jgi:hypothetical protein
VARAAEPLPQPGYAAEVPRPVVGFSVEVPDHWTVLDLDPRTQGDWLDAFLDQRLAGRPRAGSERGPARAALLDILRRLHDADVFLAAILAAEVGAELVSASVTLAWRVSDSGDRRVLLDRLRQIYATAPPASGEDLTARRVEVVQLAAGGAVRVSSREAVQIPGGRRVDGVAITQYVVPVLDTGWLALLTGTTGVPALVAGVEAVTDAMAESLGFGP